MQNNTYDKNICIVAGGSGGHIIPALVIGKNWKKKNPGQEIIFFSNKRNLDQSIVKEENEINKLILLKVENLPGKKIWLYPIFIFTFITAFFKSLYFLHKKRPSKIISTGGIIAIPVCLAGRILNIPIELYELNVIPGKTTKLLASIATNIFITFEKSKNFFTNAHHGNLFRGNLFLSPYPIRFSEEEKIFNKKELLLKVNSEFKETGFIDNRKTIFILGGSQGSLLLNNTIKKLIEERTDLSKNIQVIHQTGSLDKHDWKAFYKQYNIPAVTFTYHASVRDFYLLADLVICRGGAGTLFELEFFQSRSIIIPLKNHANDHQVENATEMVARNPKIFTMYDQDPILTFDRFGQIVDNHLFGDVIK